MTKQHAEMLAAEIVARLMTDENALNFNHMEVKNPKTGEDAYIIIVPKIDWDAGDAGRRSVDRFTGKERRKATSTVSMNGRPGFTHPTRGDLYVQFYIGRRKVDAPNRPNDVPSDF